MAEIPWWSERLLEDGTKIIWYLNDQLFERIGSNALKFKDDLKKAFLHLSKHHWWNLKDWCCYICPRDSCPRNSLSKGYKSKEPFVQGDNYIYLSPRTFSVSNYLFFSPNMLPVKSTTRSETSLRLPSPPLKKKINCTGIKPNWFICCCCFVLKLYW